MPRPRGTGAGWGGPAKGASASNWKPFEADNGAAKGTRRPVPEAQKRRLAKEERVAALIDHLEHLALNAESENIQVSATVAALNRLDGMPLSKNQHSGPDGGPIPTEVVYRWEKPEDE